MAQDKGFKARWKRLIQILDAMSGGMEFDPHEEHRRRFAAIEDRLNSMEQQLRPDSPRPEDTTPTR